MKPQKVSKRTVNQRKFHKKSQLYLLTAIFLSLLVFLIADLPTRTSEGNSEARMLYDNFITEAPKVINSAIIQGRSVTDDFDDFADKFIHYSSAKNINLSIFYIIIHEDGMQLSNKLGRDIQISTDDGLTELEDGQQISIERKDRIKVIVDSIDYPFEIEEGVTQFKLIFRTQDRRNTEIYVYG
ncbi:hypothetical protein ACFL96_03050 [Thermoproteota archaeon]